MKTTGQPIVGIFYSIIRDTKYRMLDLINFGILEGDNIRYETIHGIQTAHKDANLNGIARVGKIEDINFKDSIYYWLKNNPEHQNKEVVYNPTLNEGEKYCGNSWHYPLIIKPTTDKVFVNINFNK